MSQRALILGCGPAGLLAAYAAERNGWEPIICSRKRKSPMRGAMFLHSRIPGLPAYSFDVEYLLLGTVSSYRSKVYGPESHVAVSPEMIRGQRTAWDIRAVYDHLWDAYGNYIVEWEATPQSIIDLGQHFLPHITISTIPAYLLCWGGHKFDSTSVYISEWADFIPDTADNRVVCSGEQEHLWYRQSRIAGWANTEYPARSVNGNLALPRERMARVVKPLATDCDCLSGVVRMGRYGRWAKGVLSDSAYKESVDIFKGAGAETIASGHQA